MKINAASLITNVRPLTREEFLPFGEVIEHRGESRRHFLDMNLAERQNGLQNTIWVSKLNAHHDFPIEVTHLERHPNSDQAFIPLSGGDYIILTCPALDDGAPDVSRCKSFIASQTQGVIYRRNVWHSSMTVLSAPTEFAVVMAIYNNLENDVLFDLPRPIQVNANLK